MAKKIKFSSKLKTDTTKKTKNNPDKTPGSHNENVNKIDELLQSKEKQKLEKHRQKEAKIKAKQELKLAKEKEEKKKREEKPKPKKKSIFKSKKFDQSEIEVVKKHDKEVIHLLDENEIDDVVAEVHEGDVIYERTGFGWKGLGTRRIIYDQNRKEHVYEIIEPKLTAEEKETKKKLTYYFRTRADIDVFDIDYNDKEKYLKEALDKIVVENHLRLKGDSKDKVYYYIFREFVGYDKIDILMHDEGIEDIHCDGYNIPIFVHHRQFESIRTNIIFGDIDELDSFVIKISQMCGKQISVYAPIVDGKLQDGSRLQSTLGNTITKYSTFTIRRFRDDPLTPIDLIQNNTLDIDMAAYFWMVMEKGASILFCGGTASGKTTALNALSLFLPSSYKIVSIEDTREINLPHENWIAGTTRTGFAATEDFKTGKDIDMFDLIRVALRQRPRVIIVGEVRGKEAYTLFQAMTTGHLSYSTIHASDMHTLIQRLESKPIELPRALLTSLDLIVFLNNVTVKGEPVRRITNVVEVIKLDPESNRLVTMTPFQWSSEIDDRFCADGGSSMLHNIRLQYGWDAKELQKELQSRRDILKWMIKKNLRSYEDVGKIVSEYRKDPKSLLKRIREDKK